MLDDENKINLYTSSKHLSTLIAHTCMNDYYAFIEPKKSMPNILKDQPYTNTFLIKNLKIFKSTNDFQLPKSIKHIIYSTDDPFPNLYDTHVQSISFPYFSIFDHSLNKLLPKFLKKLSLPHTFNSKLDFPDTLEELIFESTSLYNHELILPKSLKILSIGKYYSYPIKKDTFPSELVELTLWNNMHIDEQYYPSSLKSLKIFGEPHTQIIDVSKLPRSLEELSLLYCGMKQLTIASLPPNLKRFRLGTNYHYNLDKSLFPNSLEDIKLNEWNVHEISKDTFPPNLKMLCVGDDYNRIIHSLPDKLEQLSLECWNHKIHRGLLPDTLERIYFGDAYNQPILEHMLPSSLELVALGNDFNQSISNVFVHCYKLKSLSLGTEFNKPLLPGMLPSSLQHLFLSDNFDKTFTHKSLPENLETLDVGDLFDHPIELGILPSSLKELLLGPLYIQEFIQGALPEGLTNLYIGNPDYFDINDNEDFRFPESLTSIHI
jgi:hypothetical protein